MPKKLTIEEIEERIKKIHGDTVVIVRDSYTQIKAKSKFIDRDHGEFSAWISDIFLGVRHPDNGRRNRISLEEVEKRLKAHGSNISIVKNSYKGVSNKAIFIDKDYGEWEAKVYHILDGTGHMQRRVDSTKLSLEEVEKRIKKIHKGTLTIVKDSYINTSTKAIFIDEDYGEWETTPNSILQGATHLKRSIKEKSYSIDEVKLKLKEKYSDKILLIEDSFIKINDKAKFIDKDYGEFEVRIRPLLLGETGHPKRLEIARIEKFGCANHIVSKSVRIKSMKSSSTYFERIHWKTGEILDCQASWEPKVVDYLNENKREYIWQPEAFIMPNGKTYRPDLFLVDTQTWVEIKGWMRPDAQEKWEWFKTIHPTAELWNGPKLKEMGIKLK